MKARTVAVLGAGSSGQAMAGFLALSGYDVRLWNREEHVEVERWLYPIVKAGRLRVTGWIDDSAELEAVTTEIDVAIEGADIVLICTTADAHRSMGEVLAPHISSAQPVIVMSAGTLGSLDLWRGLISGGFTDDLLVAETPTTAFGSQLDEPGAVRVTGRKSKVGIATVPGGRQDALISLLPEIPFIPIDNVLRSGLENIGGSLHVAPMVLNAGWTEAQGGKFRYYRDGITPSVAAVAARIDAERLAIANAFGINADSLQAYLTQSVGAPGGTLYESINGCEMYANVMSPTQLNHRFLWEDAMAAVIPLTSLAELARVPAPLLNSLAWLASALLGRDLQTTGRTAQSLGLTDMAPEKLIELVSDRSTFSEWKKSMAA